MAFPSNPTDGQITIVNNVNYQFSTTGNTWTKITAGGITTGGNVSISGAILPATDVEYDIGSSTNRFRSLYLSGNTIDLGGATIKTDATTGAVAIIPQVTASNPNPTGVVFTPTGAVSTVATTGGTVSANAIATASNSAGASGSGLTVSSVTPSYANLIATGSSAALSTGSNLVIVGTGFNTTTNISLNNQGPISLTLASSTQLYANVGAQNVGIYPLYILGNNGAVLSSLAFATAPVWTSYSILTDVTSVSYQLAATGAVSYALTSGSLPTGLSLSSGGLLSGTYSGAETTITFGITATNAYNQSTTQTVSFTYSLGYTAQYLVVAGGGGGGGYAPYADGYGSGGGAGGMLTGSVTMTPGTSYTITVGSGGTGYPYSVSGAGTNSQITGPAPSGFTAITSIGGGSGTGSGLGGVAPTRSGGSGGGGAYPSQPAGAGTPGQGNPGGAMSFSFQSGGGGGAGEAGKTSASQGTSGNGGNGLTWTYTGATYYAGGGGGASDISYAAPMGLNTQYGGNGGLGGGGSGRGKNNPNYPMNNTPGTINTGGGGGGGGTGGFGAGGSGVVILAVPNAVYPSVSAPGAAVSTPPAAPGLTVLKYTSSGTFTG